MAGGLLQLVAKGAQDIYLTDNPQITFFKVSYKKYTNFSIESIPHVYKGMGTFGNKITFDVQRKGDLITNTHLEVRLPAIANAGPMRESPKLPTIHTAVRPLRIRKIA